MTVPNVVFNAIFNAASAQRVIGLLRSGLRSLLQAQTESVGLTRSSAGALSNYVGIVVKLAAAWTGVRTVVQGLAAGLEFNRIIESSKLGIAALITAEANLRDEHGKLLRGTDALAAAQGLAAAQLVKLRIAGIRTAATTEELVTSFQEAVGAGISVGLTLDQIRKFTVQVAQAATNINLPFNQLNQEVRSILQGTIDRNSRIAKALQLNNAEINAAKQQNRLADLLNEKFAAFNISGEAAVSTWAALSSNIKDAVQLIAGASTEPLFIRIRDAGLKALGQVFDINQAAIQRGFRGLVDGFKIVFDEIGLLGADAIAATVRGAQKLSEWIDHNKAAIQDTVTAAGTLVREFAGLVGDILAVATGMARSSIESGKFADAIRTATGFVRFLRDHIDTIVNTLKAMIAGGLVSAALSNPIGAAIAGIAILIGYLNRLNASQQTARAEDDRRVDAFGRNISSAVRLGAEYRNLARQIDQGKLKGQDLEDALNRLNVIQDELIRTDTRYRAAFSKTGDTYTEIGKRIRGVTGDQLNFLDAQMKTLAAQQRAAQEQLRQEGADQAVGDVLLQRAGESSGALRARQQRVNAIKQNISEIGASMGHLREVAAGALRTLEQSEREFLLVTLEAREGANKARIEAALKDQIDAAKARLKTAQATAKAESVIEQDKFEQNLISAKDYYIAVKDLQLAALNREEELAKLELTLAVFKADPGDIVKATEHQKQVEERRQEVIAESNRQIIKASRQAALDRRNVETEILSFGDPDDQLLARVRRITESFRTQLDQAFRRKDFKAVIDISRLIDLRSAKEQFDILKGLASDAEDTLQRRVQEIQLNLQSGAINQSQAQSQYAEALASTHAELLGVYVALKNLQPLFKDNPAFVAFLEQMGIRIRELGHNASLAADGMLKIKAGLREAVESGLATFFENIGDDSRTAAGLFKEFANSVINDMRRIISQVIASRIIQAIFRGFGAATAAPGAPAGATGGPVGRLGPRRGTGGGFMAGPGTTTSDEIPLVWVSRREFVEPAHVVDHYGAKWFEFQRQKRLPKDFVRMAMSGMNGAIALNIQRSNAFAMGGSLSNAITARANAPQPAEAKVHLTVGVDENGILRAWAGKPGRQVILNTVGKNPRYVDQVVNKSLKR